MKCRSRSFLIPSIIIGLSLLFSAFPNSTHASFARSAYYLVDEVVFASDTIEMDGITKQRPFVSFNLNTLHPSLLDGYVSFYFSIYDGQTHRWLLVPDVHNGTLPDWWWDQSVNNCPNGHRATTFQANELNVPKRFKIYFSGITSNTQSGDCSLLVAGTPSNSGKPDLGVQDIASTGIEIDDLKIQMQITQWKPDQDYQFDVGGDTRHIQYGTRLKVTTIDLEDDPAVGEDITWDPNFGPPADDVAAHRAWLNAKGIDIFRSSNGPIWTSRINSTPSSTPSVAIGFAPSENRDDISFDEKLIFHFPSKTQFFSFERIPQVVSKTYVSDGITYYSCNFSAPSIDLEITDEQNNHYVSVSGGVFIQIVRRTPLAPDECTRSFDTTGGIDTPLPISEVSYNHPVVGTSPPDNPDNTSWIPVWVDNIKFTEISPVTIFSTSTTTPNQAQIEILHNNAPSSQNTAPTISDPVNSVFGNYIQQTRDLYIQTHGLPLAFERTYNSQSEENGPLGSKWTHTYNTRLDIYSDGVIVVNPDGRWDLFSLDPDGSYIPQKGVFDVLTENDDGTFTLTKKDRTKLIFSDTGKLLFLKDRNNNETSIFYDQNNCLDRVADPTGRELDFTTDGECKIVEIKNPANQIYTYAYNDVNNLVSYSDPASGTTHYAYDENHNLLTITDPNSHVVATNVYDDKSRVVSQKDAKGNQGMFAYDENNRVTTFTNAHGNPTQYRYDELKRVVRQVDAFGNETLFAFDENNNRTGVTDARGSTTSFGYDARGNLISVTNPLGDSTMFVYDANDNLINSTDPKGNTTQFEYDNNGNLTKTIDALGNETTFLYDATGQLVSSQDATGNTTHYDYDEHGNTKTVTNALNNVTKFVYDILSRLTSTIDAQNSTTQIEYDPLGRIMNIVDPLGNQTMTEYDPVGNVTKVTDPKGNATRYSYDEKDNLIEVIDALGSSTRYEYDALGKITQLIDANENVTNYAYDLVQRLERIHDPLNKTVRYEYDPVGNIVKFTNGENENISYEYDALNRLIKKIVPDVGETTFEYNQNGNIVKAENPNIAYQYEYDALNRVTQANDSRFGPLAYQYDALGNRTSLSNPNHFEIRYAYDALGRLAILTDFQNKKYEFAYDNLNLRTSLKYPNTTNAAYRYDATNQLLEILTKQKNKTLFKNAYMYDPAGNRSSEQGTNGPIAYQYDALSRLTKATRAPRNPLNETYGYDPTGNRMTGPQAQKYGYNAGNELTELKQGNMPPMLNTAFQYDENGNLTEKREITGAWQYDYTAENALTKATQMIGNTTMKRAQYKYDPFGRRIEKRVNSIPNNDNRPPPPFGESVEQYRYDKEDIIEIYDGTNKLVSRFTHGPGIDEPLSVTTYQNIGPRVRTETYYYHFDGLGSVIGLSNAQGQIVEQYTYDSFGNIRAIPDRIKQPYAYTSREYDRETGLYFHRARYYDPIAGRFISRDKIAGSITLPQSVHKYVYTQNNPTNLIDPDGNFAILPVLAVIGVAGAVYGIEQFVEFIITTKPTEEITKQRACIEHPETQQECSGGGWKSELKLHGEGFVSGAGVIGTSLGGPIPTSGATLPAKGILTIIKEWLKFSVTRVEAATATQTQPSFGVK